MLNKQQCIKIVYINVYAYVYITIKGVEINIKYYNTYT